MTLMRSFQTMKNLSLFEHVLSQRVDSPIPGEVGVRSGVDFRFKKRLTGCWNSDKALYF
jgi:hypothetical protein